MNETKDSDHAPLVTVAVPSKNRPDSLRRCLSSVRRQNYSSVEIIVVDDGSTPPLTGLGDVKLIRNSASAGASQARNQALREASGGLVLFLDDDAELSGSCSIDRAVRLFNLPSTGAVGFRQLEASGRPSFMQPAESAVACYAPQFFSYAAMIRTAAALSIGGFEARLGYYYEEVEFSLRLLDAGFKIVYDPSLSVVHHHDPRGRDSDAIAELLLRNWTLATLLRYPLWAVAPAAAAFWARNLLRRRSDGGVGWGGIVRALEAVGSQARYVRSERAPVRFSTLALARRLRRCPEAIRTAATG